MRATHEHEWEAEPGLPEALPADEHILWQGRPDWAALAVHAFHVRKVALYFALMMVWQIIDHHADGVHRNLDGGEPRRVRDGDCVLGLDQTASRSLSPPV